MTSESKSNIWAALVALCLVGGALLFCGSIIRSDTENNRMNEKRLACIAHLHQAGKALNTKELDAELKEGISCLKEIRPLCDDGGPEFDDKIVRLRILENEAWQLENASVVEQEALLSKVNRMVFNNGMGCYKGNCQYHVTTFICNSTVVK